MNCTLTPDLNRDVAVIAIWMVDEIVLAHSIITMVQTHHGQHRHRLMTSSPIAHHGSDVVSFRLVSRRHRRHHGIIVNRRVARKIMAISIVHCCVGVYAINSIDHGNTFLTFSNKRRRRRINSNNTHVCFNAFWNHQLDRSMLFRIIILIFNLFRFSSVTTTTAPAKSIVGGNESSASYVASWSTDWLGLFGRSTHIKFIATKHATFMGARQSHSRIVHESGCCCARRAASITAMPSACKRVLTAICSKLPLHWLRIDTTIDPNATAIPSTDTLPPHATGQFVGPMSRKSVSLRRVC